MPERPLAGYGACEKCGGHMASGITFFEVTAKGTNALPEITRGCIPTGRWFTVTEASFVEVYRTAGMPDNVVTAILANRYAFAERDLFEPMRPKEEKADASS